MVCLRNHSDQVSIIPTFVITPLSYLGGVFYSLTILPPFWHNVAMFNPVVYIISTFRYGFFNWADTNLVSSHFDYDRFLCGFICDLYANVA